MENTPFAGTFLCLIGGVMIISMVFIASAIRIVPENRRLAVYRLGRYLEEKGPGLVFLIPIVDRGVSLDTKDVVSKAQAYQNMFGAIGETRTFVHNDGEVEVDGKIWNAISTTPISPGTKVRLIKVIFEVEAL